MHRLRWDDLQFIHAVAETGSLSAAARRLNVNHATVHRRIAALEASFGVALFDRLPGGYRLRPEGRDIVASLARIDEEAGRIERSFRGVRRSIEGTFRVTTTDTIATLLLPRHLATLRSQFPEVHIELGITNLRLDFAQPLAEIALRPIRELPDDMSGEQAGNLAFGVFGAPAYLAGRSSSDVNAHDWLGASPTIARSPAGAWLAEHLSEMPGITGDSFFPLAAMAEAGMGLAVLPLFVGQARPGLVVAPQFPPVPSIPFWVATHRDLRSVESINLLIAFFAQALSQDLAEQP